MAAPLGAWACADNRRMHSQEPEAAFGPPASERLDELEIKASYAEDLLEQLNLTVYRQQQQIHALQRQLRELEQRQSSDGAAGTPRSLRDELPPHY